MWVLLAYKYFGEGVGEGHQTEFLGAREGFTRDWEHRRERAGSAAPRSARQARHTCGEERICAIICAENVVQRGKH